MDEAGGGLTMSEGRREVASSIDSRRSGLGGKGIVLGSNSENEGGRDRAKEPERREPERKEPERNEPERDDSKEPERDGGSNGLSQGPGAVVSGCMLSGGVNGRPITDDRPVGSGVNGRGPATGAESGGSETTDAKGGSCGRADPEYATGAKGGSCGGAGPEYATGAKCGGDGCAGPEYATGAKGGGGGCAGPEYDGGSAGKESGPGGVIGGGKVKFPNILVGGSGGSGGRFSGFGRM